MTSVLASKDKKIPSSHRFLCRTLTKTPRSIHNQGVIPIVDLKALHCWASNSRGEGAGVVLITPEGSETLEQTITIVFPALNNEVEYKTLLVDLQLTYHFGAKSLIMHNDSLLVIKKTEGEFKTRDPRMTSYSETIHVELKKFHHIELLQLPQEQIIH